jgi:alkanesulfonate monooxygenase SsuD/methylene tetrahydromethanopterin reductase-like flavin-dependent oxidoreductase (luciferase family)
MCRALKVLCVAADAESLAALKRVSVGAAWELAPGALSTEEALDQLDEARAHIMVVSGSFPDLLARARERYPGLRIVTDVPAEEADVVVGSPEEIRDAITTLPRPQGPVVAPSD